MGHIEGLNRNQIMMTDLESLISDNNECRVIDAFCGKLDMKKIFLPTALSPRGDLQLRISSACQSRCAALRLAFLGRHLFCCAAKVGKNAYRLSPLGDRRRNARKYIIVLNIAASRIACRRLATADGLRGNISSY